MKLKKQFNHLRIGKGLLCLLALFMMLLAPQGAWAQEDYGLTVAGVSVTSENASEITGDNISGTISFNPQTHTLTLSDATINGSIVSNSGDNLIVQLSGTNTINNTSVAFLQNITTTPTPSLTFTEYYSGLLLTNASSIDMLSSGFSGPFVPENYIIATGVNNKLCIAEYYGVKLYGQFGEGDPDFRYVTAANCEELVTSMDSNNNKIINVSYDKYNNKLTLNNLNEDIVRGGKIANGSSYFVESEDEKLNIHLVGENTFKLYSDNNGPYDVFFAKCTNVNFTTDVTPGSLKITNENTYPTEVSPFEGEVSYSNHLGYSNEDITGGSGKYHYVQFQGIGLTVAGIDVTTDNASHILGNDNETVTFDTTNKILTLNNASFTGTIQWASTETLTVKILGNSSIDATTNYLPVFEGNVNANLAFISGNTTPGTLLLTSCYHNQNVLSGWKNGSSALYNKGVSSGDAYGFDWWAKGISDQTQILFNNKYDLWVNGLHICDAQNEQYFDYQNPESNYFYFDGSNNTLTFDNMAVNTTQDPFIKNGLSSLTINLIGANTVGCETLFLTNNGGQTNNNITFTTDEEISGSLVITTTGGKDDDWYTGHNAPTVTGLVFTDKMENDVRTLTFSEPTPYDLSVAGVRVTNANATEITDDGDYFTGTATYNNETHTLTLNNVAIDLTDEENEGPGIKYWGTANLTIVLNGTNSILVQSGCEPIIYDAAELPETVPTLTFVRGSHPCSLELFGSNSPVIKNFGNVLGVNGINGATGNFLKLDSEDAMAYSQADGLHIGQGSEMSPVTSAHIVSFLLDPKFSFSDSENSGISTGGTKYYNYGQEYTMPVLKRWDDGYQTDLSGFSITYTSSDENVATISNTGAITIVGGGWAEIKAVSLETDVYAADSTWFTMEVKPADPNVSLEEGAYFTGQKLTLTRVGLNGSMYYSYGEKTVSERTAYDGEISLPAGTYDFYPFTRCGTDEQNIWSSGNAHRMLYVYNQPTISKDAGEYEGDIEVEITNLPQGVSVYYYFDDDEENEKSYTAGDKIAVRESTKLNVYLLVEGDSNKKYKTPVMKRQYVIKDIPLAVTDGDFHNHWMTYYNANGNVALSEGIGAYIATEVGASTVTVTQINSIPRGVPVLLNNETTTTTENTTVTGNKLLHADKAIDTSTGDAVYYGLYNGMMKRIYGTIPEGKNYIKLLIAMNNQPQAPLLNIVIDGENATGVNTVNGEGFTINGYFDLQGRKVSNPSQNGMYIKNGRKVVVNYKDKK